MNSATVKINNDIYEVYNDDSLVIRTNVKILAEATSKLINHFLEINTESFISNLGEVALIDAMTQWIDSVMDTLKTSELKGVLFSWEGNTVSLNEEESEENIKYDTSNFEVSENDKELNELILGRLCRLIDEFCESNTESPTESNQESHLNFSVVMENDIYNVVCEDEVLIRTNNSSLAFTSKKILDIIKQTVEDLNYDDKVTMLLTTVLSTWVEQTCLLFNKVKAKGILFAWESKIMPAKSSNFKYDSRNILTSKEETIRANEIINNYCNESLSIFNESINNSDSLVS